MLPCGALTIVLVCTPDTGHNRNPTWLPDRGTLYERTYYKNSVHLDTDAPHCSRPTNKYKTMDPVSGTMADYAHKTSRRSKTKDSNSTTDTRMRSSTFILYAMAAAAAVIKLIKGMHNMRRSLWLHR